MTDAGLPKFRCPPVVEVALSVQFQQPPSLSIAHLGLLWNKCRDRFPKVEQHGPIMNVVERRGVRVPAPEAVQFSFSTEIDGVPRLWMVNSESSELLQVQSDRFVRNWRRYHDHNIPYPSFEGRIKPEFVNDFGMFCQFAREQGLGELSIDQCEITYIKHILPCEVWQEHHQVARVFKGWSPNYPTIAGTKPESIGVRVRHELVNETGAFLGRLHIDLNSGFSLKDQTPLFLLQFVVRGQPLGSGVDGVMGFLDYGHELIVKSFADLTTEEMHRVWERTQ